MTDDSIPWADLPPLTTDQMREVDRIMVDELHITLLQMMENAGRNLAQLAVARYRPERCTVLAGPGGNGGGGLVAARHLANRGVDVEVVLSSPTTMTPVPAHQLDVLERMGVAIRSDPTSPDEPPPEHTTDPPRAVVIDALIGYALAGDPHDRAAALIRWANRSAAPVLALDAPSGLDTTSGRIGTPCVAADATLTLALPKQGLGLAPTVVGTLFAADIGVPPSVLGQVGAPVSAPFAAGSIVRLP